MTWQQEAGRHAADCRPRERVEQPTWWQEHGLTERLSPLARPARPVGPERAPVAVRPADSATLTVSAVKPDKVRSARTVCPLKAIRAALRSPHQQRNARSQCRRHSGLLHYIFTVGAICSVI